jgi:hypothetical protein
VAKDPPGWDGDPIPATVTVEIQTVLPAQPPVDPQFSSLIPRNPFGASG